MNETVRIHVQDSAFDCRSCADTIDHVLAATLGVEEIAVADSVEQLEIHYNPDTTNPNQLMTRIEEGVTNLNAD